MKFLAINQSTSELFRSIVDGISEQGGKAVLLAGFLTREEGYTPAYEWIEGCRLIKAPVWKRLWTWGRFTWQALRCMKRYRGHFALLVTNPPLVPWVGPLAKKLWGVRYGILMYDIYPDVMSRMGMIRQGGVIERFLRKVSAASMRHADCVITLGDCMKRTLLEHLAGKDVEIITIPNWADVDLLKPIPKNENPFIQQYNLAGKTVIMYSGSFGATHDIEGIVQAAELCQDIPDVCFVLIGNGTRAKEIQELVQQKGLTNLITPPWQPIDMAKYSIAAADCHIVSLGLDFAGVSIPSKTYTALAVGAAVIARCPKDTELAATVERHKCGLWVEPNNPQALAEGVRKLLQNPDLLEMCKRNARKAAVEEYSTSRCIQEYMKILIPLMKKGT